MDSADDPSESSEGTIADNLHATANGKHVAFHAEHPFWLVHGDGLVFLEGSFSMHEQTQNDAVLLLEPEAAACLTDHCIEKYTLWRRPLLLADGGTAESLAAYAEISKKGAALKYYHSLKIGV